MYFIFKGNIPAKCFKSFANAKWVLIEYYSMRTGSSIGFGQKTITDAFLKIQLQLTKFSGLEKRPTKMNGCNLQT